MKKRAVRLGCAFALLATCIGLSGCAKTYHTTPSTIGGYYINHPAKKSPNSPSILLHFTKHNSSSWILFKHPNSFTEKELNSKVVQIYAQGLQGLEANSKHSRVKTIKQVKHDRDLLKSIQHSFYSKDKPLYLHSLRYNNLKHKRLHIINVKHMHHAYYFKGNDISYHQNVKHHQIITTTHRSKSYNVAKYSFDKHHQLSMAYLDINRPTSIHFSKITKSKAHHLLHRQVD